MIDMTSVGMRVTFPYKSVYCSAKFAVKSTIESMCYGLKQIGVHIKIIEPINISSAFLRNLKFYSGETMIKIPVMVQK